MKQEQLESRSFYKKVFTLVLPMALQNLINVGITSADVIMLGKVGEKVLSGVSLAGQVQYIMQLIFFGLTSGASVLAAQYWGKRDRDTIEKIMGLALRLGIMISIVFSLAAALFPETLMKIFSSDEIVIAEGASYLRIVCISYVLAAFTMIYLNVMRSIERVKISTLVYFVSFVANVILNYLFIFGIGNLPAMGARGAALATLLARIMELVIVLVHNYSVNHDARIRFRYVLSTEKWLQNDFIHFSMPVVINELLWGLGMAVFSAILGHLGSAVSAAYSVAQVARQLALVVCFGIANATAIMIGKVIGEGKMELAREYGRRFKNLSFVMGLAGGLCIFLLRPAILSFMSVSELSKYYMGVMLFVISYYVVAQSVNTTLIVGIFRAGGDTKFGLLLDTGIMWGVSILLGFFAAFVFHFPVEAVIVILLSDEIIKVPISLHRYRQYKWLNNVTRQG
jgi:putative MATE family efflux protein